MHPKSGLQAPMAKSRALRTFNRPPVTVSPIKLSTTSTPSKMKPRTASAAAWGVNNALDARSAHGALYTMAIAPATQGLAKDVPLVFPYPEEPLGKYTDSPGAPKSMVVAPYPEKVRTSELLVAVTPTM